MTAAPGETLRGSRARHGTQSGWRTHQNRGESPCDACYRAKQEYDQRHKAAPEQARRNRLAANAQSKALSRLANLYPDLYRAFYTEEKAKLEAAADLTRPDGNGKVR